ncbi:MAG: hypothetical protein J7L32_04350 [Thermoplasmata archaeon]|nr:hypothetical protein [Thermoplasmata archaeon]
MPENKLDYGDAVVLIFYILGVLSIIGGIALSSVWAELTQFVDASGFTINTLGINGVLAMLMLVAIGIVYILVGWLVQERYKIGKMLTFVFGVLFLFAFPVGTVLGIFMLYTILGSPVKDEFTKTL